MRIAVITDAHANLPALQAALNAIEQAHCDLLVHTGDTIGIGPHPAETLELLLSLPNARFTMGNHDAWFARGIPSPRPPWLHAGEEAHGRWTHAQVDPALRDIVATWPYAIEEELGGVRVAFCHYAPSDTGRNGFAPIIQDPDPSQLDDIFASYNVQIVFYGHHHPMSDLHGRARYFNPGALGCHPSLARFAILECGNGAYTAHPRSAPYDAAPVFRDLERRAVPEREFIKRVFFAS